MNRVIKFRTWDGNVMSHYPELYDWNTEYSDLDRRYVTLIQFTGLHDKNGNEIYEGDVCRIFTDTPTEVVFKNGSFGYISEAKEFISFAENMWFYWGNYKSDKIEVIGNIYENPELLKTK